MVSSSRADAPARESNVDFIALQTVRKSRSRGYPYFAPPYEAKIRHFAAAQAFVGMVDGHDARRRNSVEPSFSIRTCHRVPKQQLHWSRRLVSSIFGSRMLRLQAVAASLLCLALTACTAAPNTYTNDETRRLTASKRSNEELPDNCSGLTVAIKARIDRLKDLQKKVTQEQQGPPPTLMAMWEGRPAALDLAKERERAAQLNAALLARGCKTLDVDEELRTAPAPATATKGKLG
jgi:hypothetical protein